LEGASAGSTWWSRGGKTHAYNYRRLLSELMVVDGLK